MVNLRPERKANKGMIDIWVGKSSMEGHSLMWGETDAKSFRLHPHGGFGSQKERKRAC